VKINGRSFRTIWPTADGAAVEIIDQTRLPHEFVTLRLDTVEQVAEAIRVMRVRGAPLIGVTAAYGVALAMARDPSDASLDRTLKLLGATRPTAINLRSIAFVGAGGSGKTSATERLAAAYANLTLQTALGALRAADGGVGLSSRLEPLGVSVIAAADAEQAARRLARREATLTIGDAPAAGPADRAAVAQIAEELRTLGVGETHLTLPATLSAAAADELAAALAPLGITHVALTHADQTTRPGESSGRRG